MSAHPLDDSSGWRAELELAFALRDGGTRLVERRHTGPLIVQRPFYPEGPVCHVYLVHPPGGVVGGDRIALRVESAPGSHAVLTTPAATKFYRAGHLPQARVLQELHATDSTLEWLPQESIFFDAARVDLTTRVHLRDGARFIGWELACYGRPASGEAFVSGAVRQRFELWRDERPLVLDRFRVDGASRSLSARWGLAGERVLGTLLAYPATREHVDEVRSLDLDATVSSTLVDGALICRALAIDTIALRAAFARIWQALRPRLLQREATPPRIWNT
jgi:urease accessory protein